MGNLILWTAAKEFIEVTNLEKGRVSDVTISNNKGTWDKAGTSVQQSVDYNGVKIDSTNGINVTSSQNTLLLNASKGIELKKKSTNETIFGVDTNGNLTLKGNINMIGGSIAWDSLTGQNPAADATNTWKDVTTDSRYSGLFYTANGKLLLKADAIIVGSNTKYEDGYDPTKIEIGGRNLLRDTGFRKGLDYVTKVAGISVDTSVTYRGYNTLKSAQSGNTGNVYRGYEQTNVPFTIGRPHTASFYVMSPNIAGLDGGLAMEIICERDDGTRTATFNKSLDIAGTPNNTWTRISATGIIPEGTTKVRVACRVWKNGTVYIALPMYEQGSKPSDHSFAPEDTTDEIKASVDNVNIGGKNLLLKSDVSVATTNYLVSEYTLSENWVPGAEYTFVIKGSLTANQIWGLWVNGSATRVAEVRTSWVNGLMYVTFTCIAITAGFERMLRLYNTPSNTTSATVEWVALYKGNKPMDWNPAPEDINQNISDSVNNVTVGARNLLLETLLDSTSPWIYSSDGSIKIESGIMPNGVKNFVSSVTGSGNYKDITQYVPVEGNTEYTFSCNAGGSFTTFLWEKKADKTPTAVYKDNAKGYTGMAWDMSTPRSTFTRTITTQPDTKYIQFIFRVNAPASGYTSGRLALAKIERGNKATDYSPAPEDALNMNIGGRNLFVNSQLPYINSNNGGIYPVSVTETVEGSTKFLRVKNSKTGSDVNTYSVFNTIPFTTITENLAGKQITVSHKVRASKTVDMRLMALTYGGTQVNWPDDGKVFTIDQNWSTVSSTYVMPSNISGNTGIRFILYAPVTTQPDLYLDYREWKIELGGKATDWNPAPEDFYNTIDNIDVGGNNVVVNSDFRDGMRHWGTMGSLTQSIVDVTDLGSFTKASKMVVASTATDDNWTYTDYIVTPGNYILSAYFKSESAQATMGIRDGTVAPLVYNLQKVGVDQTGKNTWFRASFPVTFKTQYARIYFGTQKGSANGTVYVTGVQLEMGNKITGWKQSADDLQGQISDLNSDYSTNKINWNSTQTVVNAWKGPAENGVTTIKGGLLQTGTITASKLFLGDTTNLCENPDFENDANGAFPTGFSQTANVRVKDISGFGTGGNGSNRAMELDAISGYNNDVYSNSFIPVTPGQQFYVEAEARFLNTAGNGAGRLGFSCYNAKKQHMSVWSSAVYWTNPKDVTFTKKGATWTVPANCYYVYIWISFQNNGETTNKMYIDNIRINRAASAELIVDGSITSRHIQADSITGDRIQANSLSADKIRVASFENLYTNGTFELGDVNWVGNSGTTYQILKDPNTSYQGNWYMRIPHDGKFNDIFDSNQIYVMPGEKYYFDGYARVLTGTATTRVFIVQWLNKDGGVITHNYPMEALTTSWKKISYVIEAPAAAVKMKVGLSVGGLTTAGQYTLFCNVFCRRQSGGELIVDGTITTNKLIANAITSDKIAANAITSREIAAGTITANEMSVLAKSLVNNFSMTKSLTNYSNLNVCSLVNDPKGMKGTVLKMTTANDIQLQSDFFEVNPAKSYRFKVSAYIPVTTATTALYFGLYVFNENKVEIPVMKWQQSTLTLSSPAGNPYFTYPSGGGLDKFKSGWVDMEGILTAVGTEIPAAIPANKNVDFTFLMPPEARYAKLRFFHHYSKTSVDSYWAHPSVTEIDSGMITFDQAQGGTLKLGTSTGNGFLQVVKQGANSTETVGQIDETGAYFPRVQADEIIGNVVSTVPGWMAVHFDLVNGNDSNSGTRQSPKRNVQAYLDAMPKYIEVGVEIYIINGTVDSLLRVRGFHGPGYINIRGNNPGSYTTLNAGIQMVGIACRATVRDFIFKAGNGYQDAGEGSMLCLDNAVEVSIDSNKFYGNNKVSKIISITHHSFGRIENCEMYDSTDRGLNVTFFGQAYLGKNCKGGRIPTAIFAAENAIVQGPYNVSNGTNYTRWDGAVWRYDYSYIGGYARGGERWISDIWNIDYGEATPPPPPPPSEYVREWLSQGGQNWSANGYWDDEIYVKQGDWGYGDRTGVWWFSSDLANTLRGKTIIEAQLTITRYSKGGNSGAREARIVAHQYADGRPPNNPGVSNEYVSEWFSWGETKTINVTGFVQQKIASGVDRGFGLKFANSGANYMAFLPQAKLWVKYK